MPPDIRNFFGKGGALPSAKKEATKADESTVKKRRNRRVVSDSDDDEPVPQPKKLPAKRAVKESPKGQETTTDDYFASSSKPKKSNAASVKKEVKSESSTSQKATPQKATPKVASRAKKEEAAKLATTGRKKTSSSYTAADEDALLNDEGGGGDDIFADDAKKNGRRKDDGYVESDSDDEILPKPKAVRGRKSPTMDLESDDEDGNIVMMDAPAPTRGTTAASKKRKSISVDLEEDSEADGPPKKGFKKNSTAKKPAPRKARAKKEEVLEDAGMKEIFAGIPLVRPPTPPPKDPNVKWKFQPGPGGNSGAPPEADDRDWDIGADNCLAGMTFVFTGLLQTISRDRGNEIVKKYGGRVTGAPSKKTTYVVLGTDAGPSKLRKINELGIDTIDENGLYALISRVPANGGDGKAAAKALEKKKADEAKVKAEAKKQEEEDRARAAETEKEARRKAEIRGLAPPPAGKSRDPMNGQLWTTKYAPTSLGQICGNKGQVEKIQTWLRRWQESQKTNFMMGGQDGSGKYRAIIIHGPPGIGKTTAAHLAAKLAGFDVIESNASDTRSKKLVENGLADVLNNTSLLGYFAADGDEVDLKKKKIVLIMDEVDGMSAGDRGGVGALAKICKTTEIPMILICNDRKLQKMKPFDFVTFDMPFRRPTVEQVRSRIATICLREGLKLPMNVIDNLIEGSNKDIRQIINMVSQVKLDQVTMDINQSRGMSKAWEKHVVLKPWDICHKILSGGLSSSVSKVTLNEKIELYFNDHEFSYLMVQENYLKCKPILASNRGYSEREYKFKVMELADKAAESVSDGDLVDRMIHGSQQQWGLMPTHAVFSTVRPASFMSGAMTGQTQFTQWLGNNSKAGKLSRYIKEIQSHMRMKTSADRHEIRQSYLPVMWTKTIGRMQTDGKEAVDEVISLMDSYYLTREDIDFITELGLDYQSEENAKIESQTKATFTRLYNKRSHPVPFMKASNLGAPMKAAPKVAPDLEEAIEEEDEEVVVAEPVEEDDEGVDLKEDKYIKQPKQKKPAAPRKKKATTKTAKGKKSAKADDDDDDDILDDDEEEEEEVKPKKAAKTKAKAAPRVRPKK